MDSPKNTLLRKHFKSRILQIRPSSMNWSKAASSNACTPGDIKR
jgi:hypothetical protein